MAGPDFQIHQSSTGDHQVENSRADLTRDQNLVRSLLARDACAWDGFIDQYGVLIQSRVCDALESFGIQRDRPTVEDLVAEVFATLLHNESAALRSYAGRASLATYVAVIATRCAIRSCRQIKKQRRKLIQAELVAEPTETSTSEPVETLISSEQRQELFRCIGEFPEKQRRIIELFHLEGKSYAEISHILEIPLGSVGVTLKRVEQKLRNQMLQD